MRITALCLVLILLALMLAPVPLERLGVELSLDLFTDVEYEHIEKILAAASRRSLSAGDVVCEPLTIDDTLHVLIDGSLRRKMKMSMMAVGREYEVEEVGLLTPKMMPADALAEVTVRVEHDGHESLGQAASPDTIEATLKAYISAVAAAREADGRGQPGEQHHHQPGHAG